MSRMIDIEYSAQKLIQNCQEELALIRVDINSAKRKLEEVFGNCTMIDRDKGFHILKSTKNA